MSKIAIFASGTGSNAARITEYFQLKNDSIEVDCFITNKLEAGIYRHAEAFKLPIFHFDNEQFKQGEKLLSTLKDRGIDWIVLAGFLRKIPNNIINSFEDRIINIHPSLLPKYGGKGMYGSHVHEAVLRNKEQESGITIHLVNEVFDDGEILFQAHCEVSFDDDVQSLSKKVQQLEHKHFPTVVEKTVLEKKG